ncbi:hypothetical protein CQW23_22949 [Capsicum baccatum]|uniref:Uncharacterized protein n=1 Tax=Capsicum baccatum TaxID=33114 RepID=A0A2G2W2B8_CAPBA|nr:hypothetical protein CQW23_22949 [Capsicum baccatum]
MIKGEWKIPWLLAEIIDEIRSRSMQLNMHISHTYREANQLADYMANIAIEHDQMLQFHEFNQLPSQAKKIINMDKQQIRGGINMFLTFWMSSVPPQLHSPYFPYDNPIFNNITGRPCLLPAQVSNLSINVKPTRATLWFRGNVWRNMVKAYGEFLLNSKKGEEGTLFTLEVFQRMLEFYKARKRVQVTRMFSSYPFCGLLHVAHEKREGRKGGEWKETRERERRTRGKLRYFSFEMITSIERGMWDSLYDKLHTFHQGGVTKVGTENCADSVCIEVESAERDATNLPEKLLVCESGITIEDILGKLSTYLVGDDAALSAAKQFSVKHFESLGYGNIWLFLEKNMHVFNHSLRRFFTGDIPEKPPLEPSMLDCQFDLLLSQASQCLWEIEEVDKRRISDLLMRQFPLVCLKVAGNDFMIE